MTTPSASHRRPPDGSGRTFVDPRLLLRWIYIGRLCVASAIFLASLAVFSRYDVDKEAALIATIAFVATAIFTLVSAGYSEVYRRPLKSGFLYLQALFDVVLVTAVVHVTSVAGIEGSPASVSQFAPLYILVIATSSLLLPGGGSLLIATLANLLYVVDVSWVIEDGVDSTLWLQLFTFAAVALLSAYLGAELRRSGEASNQLRAEHESVRLRAEEILRNIRSGVVTVDARGRLLYANPTAERLLGLDLSASVGQPVMSRLAAIAPELTAALEAAAVKRAGGTAGAQRIEGRVFGDGRDFPVGVTTTYMEDEATGVGTAIAIFQDISDNKRLEAMRVRAERLEGIAELSASLAHEIKNPLASIRSSAEQLSKMPRRGGDERTLTDLVVRESDRLSRLLSEFLDFARVPVVRSEVVDLRDVLRSVSSVASVHPDRPDGVRIVCSYPGETDLTVQGDEDLLHRAIFNLTLNAVQASPPGGEVRLELVPQGVGSEPDGTDPAHFGVLPRGGAVVLRVIDSGSGIPLEVRDRLFDPFFTTKPNGSGLGLAVVHRAVEAHRGLVLVDSAARGTRFTVILPRTRVAAAQQTNGTHG